MRVVKPKPKPKPKQSQWPTTTNVNNATNQWEPEANTRNQSQARENACDFGFASDWLRRWRDFLNQSRSKVKQNQSNSGLLSTLNWKPLYQLCNLLSLTNFTMVAMISQMTGAAIGSLTKSRYTLGIVHTRCTETWILKKEIKWDFSFVSFKLVFCNQNVHCLERNDGIFNAWYKYEKYIYESGTQATRKITSDFSKQKSNLWGPMTFRTPVGHSTTELQETCGSYVISRLKLNVISFPHTTIGFLYFSE